jgi:hypothetical protein
MTDLELVHGPAQSCLAEHLTANPGSLAALRQQIGGLTATMNAVSAEELFDLYTTKYRWGFGSLDPRGIRACAHTGACWIADVPDAGDILAGDGTYWAWLRVGGGAWDVAEGWLRTGKIPAIIARASGWDLEVILGDP